MARPVLLESAAIFSQLLMKPSRYKHIVVLLVLTCALITAPDLRAQLTTFAQFIQASGGNPFTYASSGNAGSGGQATLSCSNVAVNFQYLSIANLPADLTGFQNATLTFSSFTSLGATLSSNGFDEIFNGNGVQSAVITITRDTPAAEGNGTRTILLQAVFTPYTFSGSGGSGGFSASSLSGGVSFASDFLSFAGVTQRDLGLTFSSIVPGLTIDGSGFLRDFTAAGTGTFSSNPLATVVPEPGSFGLVGAGLALGVAARFWRRRYRWQ